MSSTDVAVRVGRRVGAVQVERAVVLVLVIVTTNVEHYARTVIVAIIGYFLHNRSHNLN